MGSLRLALILLLTPMLSLSGALITRVSAESGVELEVVAKNLQVPWSLAFSSDGRLFFTERQGRVRVIQRGEVKPQPLIEISVAALGEAGLLGLALDPNFGVNQRVYVYYTYSDSSGRLWNRVASLTEREGQLGNHTVILDRIPGSGIHDGGRIKFGPDGKLYVTTGDAANSSLAQDLSSLAGKVLRINPDGSIPSDNPFPNSPVYTWGHRNPQGLDWHPITGRLFETEHGPVAHDEVNILEPGKNYGWPVVTGKAGDPRFVDPIIESGSDTWAPSGASFHRSGKLLDWKNNFFFAALRGQHLRRVALKPPNSDSVDTQSALFLGQFGRLRDVVEGPDGYLYFSTSNRDGRGFPEAEDDRILRVKPASQVFNVVADGRAFTISVASNSSLSSFAFDQALKQVSYLASGADGTTGFSDVTIPKELLGGPFTLSVDEAIAPHTLFENSTHSTIFFAYSHSSRAIKIVGSTVIPEFRLPLLVLGLAVLVAIWAAERVRHANKTRILIRT